MTYTPREPFLRSRAIFLQVISHSSLSFLHLNEIVGNYIVASPVYTFARPDRDRKTNHSHVIVGYHQSTCDSLNVHLVWNKLEWCCLLYDMESFMTDLGKGKKWVHWAGRGKRLGLGAFLLWGLDLLFTSYMSHSKSLRWLHAPAPLTCKMLSWELSQIYRRMVICYCVGTLLLLRKQKTNSLGFFTVKK